MGNNLPLHITDKNPKLALIGFYLVFLSCIALSIFPELSWIPLVVATLSVVIRITWKQPVFRSTHLNFLVPLFLISSFIGLLVAYNKYEAVHKFFLIVLSVLLFYSITYQTQENLWIIAISLGVYGILTTIIFILTNNWSTFPADIQFVENFGNWWVKLGSGFALEPYFNFISFHANIVAGINAIILPLCAISSFHYWKINKKYLAFISLSILILLCIGLLITSSRAAWVATFLGLSILVLFITFSKKAVFPTNKYLYILIPLIIVLTGIFAPSFLANNLNNSGLPISEVTSFESRLQIAKQTHYLITDFPFTGGGLGSFPGLYSQYILAIPFFMFGYSHNLYLDLLIEQGIFGFVLWSFIIISCFVILGSIFRKQRTDIEPPLFSSAIFAGLIIFLIHGIIDDPIYSSNWGLPILFLFPGLTIALSDKDSRIQCHSNQYLLPSFVILITFASVLFLFRNQIKATWYANIGAIHMAKSELAVWPPNEWNKRSVLPVYNLAESYFKKSLSNQEENFSANYRQGLIWMERYNFQQALSYMETAFKIKPEHRGAQKNLGYCYTWLGKFEQAELVLKQIPEAQYEMEVYEWWWHSQGRDDLAEYASIMTNILSN